MNIPLRSPGLISVLAAGGVFFAARMPVHEDIIALMTAGILAAGGLGIYRFLKRGGMRARVSQVIIVAAVAGMAFALQPSTLSKDLEDYISCAAVFVSGGNPYETLCNVSQTFSYTYGPIFLFFSSLPIWLAQGNTLFVAVGLKLMLWAVHLLNTWLVARLARARWGEAGVLAAMAYALNPVVLFESLQGAHNETLMVMFILAGIFAATMYRRFGIALLSLCAGGLTKFVAFLGIPLMLIAAWYARSTPPAALPTKGMRLFGAVVFMLTAGALLFSPSFLQAVFWQTANTSPVTTGPMAFLLYSFGAAAGFAPVAAFTAAGIAASIAGMVFLLALWHMQRKGSIALVPAFAGSLAVLLIFSPHFLVPWYLLLLYPFMPLVFPPSQAIKALTMLSLVGAAGLVMPLFLTLLVGFLGYSVTAIMKQRFVRIFP
jgi:hypothetical protein